MNNLLVKKQSVGHTGSNTNTDECPQKQQLGYGFNSVHCIQRTHPYSKSPLNLA